MITPKNILVHGVNGIWWGHIRRLLCLLDWLKDASEREVFFATNCSFITPIQEHSYTLIPLLYWIDDTLSSINFDQYQKYLLETFSAIIKEKSIDIMIHDTFFSFEVVKKFPSLKHILVLRNSESSYLQDIEKYFHFFDSICIPHHQQELSFDKRKFFSHYQQVSYIGYVWEKLSYEISDGSIVFSVWYWGNKEEVKKVFSYFLELINNASDILSEKKLHFFLWKHYEDLSKTLQFPPESILHTFNSEFSSLLWKAELYIWSAWYNTVNEILRLSKKAFFFPLERSKESQKERVEYFQSLFWEDYYKLWTQNIFQDTSSIKTLLSQKQKSISDELFTWVQNFSEIMSRYFQEKKVLLWKHIYLPRSEYFIYREILALKNTWYTPYILCFESKEREKFPYKYVFQLPGKYKKLFTREYPHIFDKKLYIECLLFIQKFIEKEDISLVYTEFLFDGFFLSPLKKLMPNIAFFSAARGNDVYHYLPVIWSSFLSNFDAVFVRDEVMKTYLTSYPSNISQIVKVRSYLDLEEYRFEKKTFQKTRLLIGGRFTPKKQIPLLLNLWELLLKNKVISHVGIIGDGEEKEEILEKIQTSRYRTYFQYHGMLTHDDLIELFWLYDIYINYSKKAENGDDEGIPNLISENMLSWNLVFSTLTWGIGEILQDGETGYTLCGDISVDALKIQDCLEKADFSHIIDAAREKIHKEFSYEQSISKIISCFTK